MSTRSTVMVEISASLVKELREQTGAAMMDCKKALVEAAGDKDKATELLRQRGMASASKKSARATSEGKVVAKVSADGKQAVLLEVNCETDFVARNDEFASLCEEIAQTALDTKCGCVETLLTTKSGGQTIDELVKARIAKTGENMVVKRVAYLNQDGNGMVGSYVHTLGGKMGALLSIATSKPVKAEDLSATARDVSMHIVSAKPQFVSRKEISADVIENEKRIEAGKEDLAKKPAEIREKIVTGRVDKLLAERCLLEQPFVKDPSQTVTQVLAAKGKELGAELTPTKFVLFILGDTDASEGQE